jgi:hypothetical protein
MLNHLPPSEHTTLTFPPPLYSKYLDHFTQEGRGGTGTERKPRVHFEQFSPTNGVKPVGCISSRGPQLNGRTEVTQLLRYLGTFR